MAAKKITFDTVFTIMNAMVFRGYRSPSGATGWFT